jgi:uncharacterized membrane protein YdjX (TVP38/TMEM64 family)
MEYRKIAKQNISDALIRGTIIVIFFLLIIALGWYFKIDPDKLKQMFMGASIWRVAITYIFMYVAVTFFIWLSKDIFQFIAAVIFGPFLSTMLVFLAETINAAILFTLSRYLGKGFVDSFLKGSPRDFHNKISRSNLWTLFTLRAVPLVPFRFLDLACGLTKIRLSQYLMVVVLASPARIFWVQYILSGLGEAAFKNPGLLVNYLLENRIAFIWSFAYLVLAVILAFKLKRKI